MIRWPPRFAPGTAPVHVSDHLEVQAPPERVWGWLVRAPEWPRWYSNSSDVQIDGGGRTLAAGSTFQWKTFGLALRSQVQEFEPPARLAWNARGFGVEAYHAWLLSPTSNGCQVLTEESQYGALARLSHGLRPQAMDRGHRQWLEALKGKAEGGAAPP